MSRLMACVAFLTLQSCSVDAATEPKGLSSDSLYRAGEDARAARRALRAIGPRQGDASPTIRMPRPLALDPSDHYAIHGPDSVTFCTDNGLAFALASGTAEEGRGWGLRFDVGNAKPFAEGPLPGRVHRWVGAQTSWMPGVATYARVVWEEIQPGIDMLAAPEDGGVAYRFVLSPHAKLEDLVMHWRGADQVRAVDGGSGFDVTTGIGVLHVRGLRAFAVDGDQRRELVARHVVHGQDVTFEIDGWDHRGSLVIDPTVTWTGLLGGSGSDAGLAVAIDAAGNAVVAGRTYSSDFPITLGVGGHGVPEALVAKITPAGAVAWAATLGGVGFESSGGVAVDAAGNVFVTGRTGSGDFPTTAGAFSTLRGGIYDGFIVKLSSAGALLWSTYFGGSGDDSVSKVAVDPSGNVLVAGFTGSPDLPTTGGFDKTFGGASQTVWVAKFTNAGALVWSSYVSGTGGEANGRIAVDSAGNAFVAGITYSSDFPIVGGYDKTLDGGGDSFVAKVTPAGALSWSTYVGGNGYDGVNAIAVDASGDAFIVGDTGSTDLATSGGFQKIFGGTQDAWITKLTSAGAHSWSSYLGGGSYEYGYGVAIDGDGDVFIAGTTQSSGFATAGAFDSTLGGGLDGYVTKVSGKGTLLWSSYLGGSADDTPSAVAADAMGNAYVVGETSSSDFATAGSFDSTLNGVSDAFITRLSASALGSSCAIASECRSSFCVDGVCCDSACTGACFACSAAKKGAGVNGTCAAIADGRDPDAECTPQSCTSSTVTKARRCNGAGACRDDGTISCGLFACSGIACATTCSSDASCAPSAYCAGSACASDLDAGAACTRGAQCKSGFCADGVCCDKACDGPCEACTAAKKGGGVDGTCANVVADTDPRDRCVPGTGACAADGLCDGAGNCRSFAKAGTACGPTTCSSGVIHGKVCKGDEALCIESSGIGCAPYGCAGITCGTTCAADDDCATNAYCTGTACTPKAPRGTACSSGRECASGFCADGVCCSSACTGTCEACNEAETAGTCTPVSGAPRGSRAACDALAADDCAKTTCNGEVTDRCAGFANGTTTRCGSDTCTADKKLQRAGACDGLGGCKLPEPRSCTPFVCDIASATGCKSACEVDDDCAAGFKCSESKCVQGATCNSDKTASRGENGIETPCAPYACGTDGKCLDACTASDQCVFGAVCDSTSKICFDPDAGAAGADSGCGCRTTRTGRASALFGLLFVVVTIVARRRPLSRHGAVLASSVALAACTNGADVSIDAGTVTNAVQTDPRAMRRDAREAWARMEPPARAAQPVVATSGGGYRLRHPGGVTFFRDDGLAFSLSAGDKRWGLRATIAGARAGALRAEAPSAVRVREYIGPRDNWRQNLSAWDRVVWDEIRPGIDMWAQPAKGGIEYGFAVSSGAELAALVMHWQGANALRVVEGGGLDVETDLGVLRIRGLRAFAVDGDRRTELVARHVVRGWDTRLVVDGWDGRGILVIDPTATWTTYVGGSANEFANAVAGDGSGAAYVIGQTPSADFPTTIGLDTTIAGTDAYVSKFSAAAALSWSTFVGGSGSESAAAIAVDLADVWVGGVTRSTNLPVPGGFDTTLGGTSDGFVTRLSDSGELVWGSYLGGAGDDSIGDLAIDVTGNLLLGGRTASSDFPTTAGLDTTFGGVADGFVAKLAKSGTLTWSTYLGGTSGEGIGGVAVDASGSAFVVGSTYSADFPATASAPDTTYAGGGYGDGFVAKLTSSGSLSWATYLGGSQDESALRVSAASGSVIVAGYTYSADFPTTGGIDKSLGGAEDGFVTKLTSAGALTWSTYVGGASADAFYALATDKSGNIFLTGESASNDYPTQGGFDKSLGGTDAVVTKISPAGTILWSSFLGGSLDEYGYGIALDGSDNVFIVGFTQSADFATVGVFDVSLGGLNDGFLTRIPTLPLGSACAAPAFCASSLCVDGVCCDKPCTGSCEACSAAKRGTGSDGICGFITDGKDPDAECTPSSCSVSTMTNARVCNGAGSCRSDGTTDCSPYACAGTACASSCVADTSCIVAAHCNAGVCVVDLDEGAACSRAAECKSGFCADGVCCNSACAGPCEACSAARKGAGLDGTCANVPADTDPRDRCAKGTGTCAADGFCDGAGNCRSFAKASTPCGPTACAGGIVSGKVCKGDDASCIDSAGTPCAPYVCGAVACKTTCTDDLDCAETAYCNSSGACEPKTAAGEACSESHACLTGLCADGVCCNTACSGQCEACNEPGTAGTCVAVSGKPRGKRAACDALDDLDCAHTSCDHRVRDKCAGYANGTTVACGKAECTADGKVQKAGACDGFGRCAQPEPLPCTPFVCNLASATGCATSCAADTDCSDGFSCNDGKCVQGAKCSIDGLSSIDKTGNATACAPYRCGEGGKCRTGCDKTDQCAAGAVCDTAVHACVPPTTSDDGSCAYGDGRRTPSSLWLLVFTLCVALRRERRS